jgi:tRNA G18 (ribose-2'-O)-methylase SpoU
MTAMPVLPLQSFDDARLAPYRELKDRTLAARHGLFVAEGEHLVRRLLASDFQTASVLLADRRAEEISPLVPSNVNVFVLPQDELNGVVGYKFHSGVIAMGIRKPSPSLSDVIKASGPVKLVLCPDTTNGENLGSLIRLSAGFGADAMLVGPRSIDPFMRQVVRVSMGTIFQLPIVQSADFSADLRQLKQQGVRLIASMLDPGASPLPSAERYDRSALLFGNEAQGLDADTVSLCDDRVTIPMHRGTDSLNVAVAAGIFLYHYWG